MESAGAWVQRQQTPPKSAGHYRLDMPTKINGQPVPITCSLFVNKSYSPSGSKTPLLVFAGLAFGHHLHLDFTPFDISAIALGVVVVAFVCYDGVTNWLEGAQLMAVYVILAITSFYLGAG